LGRTHLLFGRNVFEEALRVKAPILEVYAENPSAKDFAESLMRQARLPLNIVRPHLPKEVKEQSHQGLAFRTDFDFRISEGALNSENFPRILFANHIEDVPSP